MGRETDQLLQFLVAQTCNYGGKEEIEPGQWVLFAVENSDEHASEFARSLLSAVDFPVECGQSEDDLYTIHYVETTHRAAAIYWLDHLVKTTSGKTLPPSPEQRVLIHALLQSDKPLRVAQQLAAMHTEGKIHAGLISTPNDVRGLLDRLHQREPLFFAALNTLLEHHLIDMIVLFQKLIDEDLNLQNEIVKSGLSRDPFLQTRQDATAEIRNMLIRFFVISPMDQLKNTGISNPYAAHLDVGYNHGHINASIDGIKCAIKRENYLDAIHSIRAKLYRGESFETFGTQSPWMTAEIANPFRYIRERINKRPDLTPLDALYMLERAVAL